MNHPTSTSSAVPERRGPPSPLAGLARGSAPAACAALLALAACTAPRSVASEQAPGTIAGRLEGASSLSPGSRVEVYCEGPGSTAVPLPFADAKLDTLGRFRTGPLPPGRYVLVWRGDEAPPSITATRVPAPGPAEMQPIVASGLVQLRIDLPAAAREPVRCRLTEAAPPERVPDRRDVLVEPRSPRFVRGLRPGRWRIDLPTVGASTEIDLPAGVSQRQVSLDFPPIAPGAELDGRVTLLDGSPCGPVAVTARRVSEPGSGGEAWARFAMTDAEGRYRILGLPPGPCMVRVEDREVLYQILPAGRIVEIPPSGKVDLGFVVEP